MGSTTQIAEVAGAILFYGSLFAATIRQNRKNRGILLGVATVAMFCGFLLYASLESKHAPAWLLGTLEGFIILAGLGVLAALVRDFVRWATGKHPPAVDRKDGSAAPGPRIK
jgi:hypothetical protein